MEWNGIKLLVSASILAPAVGFVLMGIFALITGNRDMSSEEILSIFYIGLIFGFILSVIGTFQGTIHISGGKQMQIVLGLELNLQTRTMIFNEIQQFLHDMHKKTRFFQHPCPQCGSSTHYFQEKQDYYCWTCKEYLNKLLERKQKKSDEAPWAELVEKP